MKYFLINTKLPETLRRAISVYGEIIPIPILERLPQPVCSHPDMLIAKIGNKLLIHEEYREGQALLKKIGIPFSVSHSSVGEKYPEDVRLNCLAAETFFLSNEKHVSREALALADQSGLHRISVAQGYAKCACACAKNAIATMDKGIAKAALREGIDVLLLEEARIGIEIYDTGFIGGASVLLNDHTLGFFGRIESFGQYRALAEFFGERGVRLLSLGDAPIFDYGGAIDFDL